MVCSLSESIDDSMKYKIQHRTVPGIPRNILRNVAAAIQDNLPSLTFKLFPTFAKTWLSTRNRRNRIPLRYKISPPPPLYRRCSTTASIRGPRNRGKFGDKQTHIHPTDLKRFLLRAQATQGGHVKSLNYSAAKPDGFAAIKLPALRNAQNCFRKLLG